MLNPKQGSGVGLGEKSLGGLSGQDKPPTLNILGHTLTPYSPSQQGAGQLAGRPFAMAANDNSMMGHPGGAGRQLSLVQVQQLGGNNQLNQHLAQVSDRSPLVGQNVSDGNMQQQSPCSIACPHECPQHAAAGNLSHR